MFEQEHHEMVLASTHDTGAEEWFCPTCGRRFLMRWPPAYEKTILEAGDEYAIHSGGKGGLSMGGASLTPLEQSDDLLLSAPEERPENPVELSPELLSPWERYIESSCDISSDADEA